MIQAVGPGRRRWFDAAIGVRAALVADFRGVGGSYTLGLLVHIQFIMRES